jgi:hypothetical protein
MSPKQINRIKCGYVSERDLVEMTILLCEFECGLSNIDEETILDLKAAIEEHCCDAD